MAVKNRFYKGTLGIKTEVAIASSYDAVIATHKLFVETAAAGAIGVFWDDTNAVVATGATALAANASRKFFYAWKQADGTAMRSTAFPAGSRVYTSVPYSAGQADVLTITFGGTIAVGQTLHVKVIDGTFPQIPYPSYDYDVKVTTTLADALTALAAKINAEKGHDGAFTASAGATTLVVTGTANGTIKVAASLEVSVGEQEDNSAITIVHTTKGARPIGTFADIKELEKHFLVMNGAILYTGGMTNVDEWQAQASNVAGGTNYGQLIVRAMKFEKGEVHSFHDKAYMIVALPTASLAALAAL